MRAGRLRHTVEIQRATEAADATGQMIKTWSTIATRKAEIIPLSGDEYMDAQQIQSKVTHRVTMRYYDGLTSVDRLYWAAEEVTLNVEGTHQTGQRKTMLELLCVEET